MPPSFLPGLINGASGDPGLFIPFAFQRRALAFDLGDNTPLSPRDLLKISHVFVSHTHMDHFAGFDRLLRILLGREKRLHLFGPQGFLKNLEGKLSGYTWNLVDRFESDLTLLGTEVTETGRITRQYPCRLAFRPTDEQRSQPDFTRPQVQVLHQEPSHAVYTAILDHGTPCLGFALKESLRVHIRKEGLADLGLAPGPWIQTFKQAVYDRRDPGETISAATMDKKKPCRAFSFGELLDAIAIVGNGRKIAYIADAGYNGANLEKILALAKDADHLFIEAAFLEQDRDLALQKHHLTARQAGEIAGLAGVKRFTLFHFSPRYQLPEQVFYDEATAAMRNGIDKNHPNGQYRNRRPLDIG